jgi:ribonucleotide monophosphatase NagD (HAD superfamily)
MSSSKVFLKTTTTIKTTRTTPRRQRRQGRKISSSTFKNNNNNTNNNNNMESILHEHEIKDIFLDQFGVLHDGKNAFPEAIECLRRIHHKYPDVRVHVLSNSSRRRTSTLRKLKRMGFEDEWFQSAMTSGEVCHMFIEKDILNTDTNSSSSFTFLHLNWGERGAVSLPSGCVLPQSKEEAIEKTTHVVASGCESMSVPGTTLGSYDRQVQNIQRLTHEEIKEVLTGIAKRCEENGDLPPKMLLANPDFVTVNGDALEVMPGTISLWYRDILNEVFQKKGEVSGGAFNADEYVVKLGKPAPIIYTTLCEEISGRSRSRNNEHSDDEKEEKNAQTFFSKCLCVGDSLEHDIKGAQSVNAKSCFIVETGIHAEELDFSSSSASGGDGDESEFEAALEAMCEKYKVASPTCTIAKFSWN